MECSELIYLDNAATSFPKPVEVIQRVCDYMTSEGGNAGRGSHLLAMKAAERVFECRSKLSDLFDGYGEERVCFTLNTTYALNSCIKGMLRKGDHVLISDMEHNAVYRPIYKLYASGFIEYDIFPSLMADPERSARAICEGIERLVRRNTKMLICSGASNISSVSMPLIEIGKLCRRLGIIFVVDGAQCAGHFPISIKQMNIDALCIPAHKGLLGPQGCGAMILGEEIQLSTQNEGGNGVDSLSASMSDSPPERYEAGTLPLPAIAGLSVGIDTLLSLGIERVLFHEKKLFCCARDGLSRIGRVKIYTPFAEGSVLLFNIEGMSSEAVARELSEKNICVRGGFHCSSLGHKTLGTQNAGGVRVSFGPFNSSKDVDALCDAVGQIAAQ